MQLRILIPEICQLYQKYSYIRTHRLEQNESHSQDKSGKSKFTSIEYFFKSEDVFWITCTDWTAKMRYPDNLTVGLFTEEFQTWVKTKAYK